MKDSKMDPATYTLRDICNAMYVSDSPMIHSFRTTNIIHKLGLNLSTNSRYALLKKLHILSELNIVKKFGRGKYTWRLSKNWKEQINAIESGEITVILPDTDPQPSISPSSSVDVLDHTACNEKIEELTSQIFAKDKELGISAMKIVMLEKESKETKKTIVIKWPDKTKLTLNKTPVPKTFERILELAQARMNVLLVGPAGCGKTFLAELISKALKFYFGSISCTSGMTETHLLGRSIPDVSTGKSRYQGTEFIKCYEKGGLFLLDEIDSADSNMMIAIHAALANGKCNVPNRPVNAYAERHENFTLIATANTYGRGADRMYAGRNQLDEATLDRFRIGMVECDYDAVVEKHLCPDDELRERCQSIRKRIEEHGLRRVMSTRFLKDAYAMQVQHGWDVEKCLQGFFEGWTREEKAKVKV